MKLASIKDIQTDRVLRNARYDKLEQLFNGEHAEVFGIEEEKKEKYVVINYLRKISKVVANALAKYPPKLVLPKKENQEFVEEIAFNSNLDTQLFESALATSSMGDAYFCWEIEGVEDVVKGLNGEEILIKSEYDYCLQYIDPRKVEMITDKFNKSKIVGFIVDGEFEEKDEEGKTQKFYKRITHEKNRIIFETFKVVNGKQADIENRVEYKVVNHNLNRFFIYHIPNFRKAGQLYGDSDYIDAIHLQMEINNRITQLVIVFDKHGQPKLIMDSNTFHTIFSGEDIEQDENGNKYVNIGDLEVICVDDEKSKIEMLTWDAKTTDSLELLKFTVNQLLSTSDTAPELLGSAQTGGSVAESGKALKIRIIATEDKVERLKKYYTKALKDAFYTIQLFEFTYATNPKIKSVEKVDIHWKPYIPADEKETVEIAVALKSNNLVDDETILKQTLGYTQEQTDAIMQKKAEQEEKGKFLEQQASQFMLSGEEEQVEQPTGEE